MSIKPAQLIRLALVGDGASTVVTFDLTSDPYSQASGNFPAVGSNPAAAIGSPTGAEVVSNGSPVSDPVAALTIGRRSTTLTLTFSSAPADGFIRFVDVVLTYD